MTDWQPIETAPKNGDRILLAQGERIEVGYWLDTSHHEERLFSSNGGVDIYELVKFPSGRWNTLVQEGSEWMYPLMKPTHWMPLPEPPKGN